MVDLSVLDGVRGRLPLIVYELNEVSWRIVDWYIGLKPRSNIAKILHQSLTYTTVTEDKGELHPWSTWPTVHRGIYNDQHKILFINQDLSVAKDYPPVWEILSKRGYKVGVFGSLQSYPLPANGSYSFYIPDTFSPSPETLPSCYAAFQRINLRQTAADAAVASDVQIDYSLLSDLVKLPFIGVRPSTFVMLATQLVNEVRGKEFRTRRPLLQAPLAFDVFTDAFCTFFTNHVAGAMHRYWRYVFPQDFGQKNTTASDQFKSDTVLTAMDIADSQIGNLKQLAERDGGSLLILSSMGQEAICRGAYYGELRLSDSDKFLAKIGFRLPFKANLAMQPDCNFEFDSSDAASEFMRLASSLCDHDGKSIWHRMRSEGPTVNLGLGHPKSVIDNKSVCLHQVDGTVKEIPLAELGLQTIYRDPGTGYHQPKGILIWHGSTSRPSTTDRSAIGSRHIKDMMVYAMARD